MPMTYEEARPLAESLVAAMRPFCERAEIAGSIRRRKPENIKDIELVLIPRWEGRADPTDLFGERMTPTNLLHEWAMSDACPVVWIKPGEIVTHWRPNPAGRYWRGILPQGGSTKASPIAELLASPKVDVFITEPRRWGATFLIRTGSAEFGPIVMGHAKRVGYQFVEGDLTRDGGAEIVPVPEEEDVFRVLGLQYVAPEDRLGPAQVVPVRGARR